MKMLLDFGIENVRRRILKLTDRLMDLVKELRLQLQTPEEEQYRSGIVNFRIDKAQDVAQKLGKRGIVISARSHGIRVSPHFYNTEEEIEKLVNAVKKEKKTAA
jgi:selenocysteine lyase/cysteine desulfurase